MHFTRWTGPDPAGTVDAPLFTDLLFSEQCSMVEFHSRARKQQFSAFHLLVFRTQFIIGPMHSK